MDESRMPKQEELMELESSDEKYLSDTEMVKMELAQSQQKLAESKIESMTKDIAMMEMQKQLNLLRNELAAKTIAEYKRQLSDKKAELNAKKEEIRKFNKDIAAKHELEEGWGYNPDTGLIK